MEDAELATRLDELEARLRELSLTAAAADDLDVVWIIISAVLVFFMQVGFAMVSLILLRGALKASNMQGKNKYYWRCCRAL